MIARTPALLLVLLASLFVAAGCGGDDAAPTPGDGSSATGGSGDAGQVLELGVDGNKLAFDPTRLEATAGKLTLRLDNTSTIQHDLVIEDAGGTQLEAGELVGKGESTEVTVTLEPGTYTYFCSPHKSSGMTGTLTVT